jgi:hypothetical protein
MMCGAARTVIRMGRARMRFARRISASRCSHTVGMYGRMLIDFYIMMRMLERIPRRKEIEMYVFLEAAKKKFTKLVKWKIIDRSRLSASRFK